MADRLGTGTHICTTRTRTATYAPVAGTGLLQRRRSSGVVLYAFRYDRRRCYCTIRGDRLDEGVVMQKTLEIYLREQRELIANAIYESCRENCECSKTGITCGCACRISAVIALSSKLEVDTEVNLAKARQEISNVIKLPTRTRPSDTRE